MKTFATALLSVLLYKFAITVSDYVHVKSFYNCLKSSSNKYRCNEHMRHGPIEGAIFYQMDMIDFVIFKGN